jgi:hypothetical protein
MVSAMAENATREITQTLSKGEQPFATWRHTIGLFLGPILALVISLRHLP